MENENQEMPSTGKLLLRLFVYVLYFAVPATALALLFPRYAPEIVIVAGCAFIGVSAFKMGTEWDSSLATVIAKKHAKNLAFMMISMPLFEGLVNRCSFVHILQSAVFSAAIALLIFPLFYIGRYYYRWRTAVH